MKRARWLWLAVGGATLALVACGGNGASSDGGQADLGRADRADASSADGGPGPGDAAADDGTSPGEDGGGSTTPSDASTGGGTTLCTTLGWCQVTSTKIEDVVPSPLPGGYAAAIVSAWSGAAADVDGNALYIWGGGHNDYHGNEVYLLDLETLQLRRLNEPSPSSAVTSCNELYSDGLPSSRHTYDSLAILPSPTRLFAFGGSIATCGYLGDDTMIFNPATLSWSRPATSGPPHANPGVMADYHAATGKLYLHDTQAFYRFDPTTSGYTLLNDDVAVDYHMTGRIDPTQELFVMMGGGQIRAISIASGSSYALLNWDAATTGCAAVQGASSPGLAWDPDQGALVAWPGGADVYLFDPATKTCTKKSFNGGPGAAQPNGTFGRFRYFPQLKVFAVVNAVDQDAYTLRMIP